MPYKLDDHSMSAVVYFMPQQVLFKSADDFFHPLPVK
jgi:hypothetical protein